MNIVINELMNLLSYLFNITGDWGLAIVLLTVLVRLVFIPISIRQRIGTHHQIEFSKKTQELKNRYKNDSIKLAMELKKYQGHNQKYLLGCFLTLLQLPIVSSLYYAILRMPIEFGSVLVPWVATLKLTDNYFVIPLIYIAISISPSLLSYIDYFKITGQAQMQKSQILFMSIFSAFLTLKLPIAIGIYFITTGTISFIEELIFRLYMRKKCLS